jgi:hypothetical protein
MARTLATICVTLSVLLGSAGVSWSADFQNVPGSDRGLGGVKVNQVFLKGALSD